jgi:hypothetical protein
LEEALNSLTDILTELSANALGVGDAWKPDALISAVTKSTSPLDLLVSSTPPDEPFLALSQDAPGSEKFCIAAATLTDQERAAATRLLQWAIRELFTWSARSDPERRALGAIFAIFQRFGMRGEHWDALPVGLATNTELRDTIVELIGKTKVEISLGPGRIDTRKRALLNEIVTADKEQNWVEVARYWDTVSGFLHSPLLFSQGSSFLARYFPDELLCVVDAVSQTTVAWLIAKVLTADVRFELARRSTSERFAFASMLAVGMARNASIPQHASADLIQILIRIGGKAARWKAWMKLFNEYPSRYAWLQLSLGAALANLSAVAIKEYVDSIHLSLLPWNPLPFRGLAYPDSRSCVGHCLTEFQKAASEPLRKTLWSMAYEHWKKWDFGTPDEILVQPCRSALDYALAGNSQDNLTHEERQNAIESARDQIIDLENKWFSSVTEILSERNRIISRIQPLLVVEQKIPDDRWLATDLLWPQGYAESEYEVARAGRGSHLRTTSRASETVAPKVARHPI